MSIEFNYKALDKDGKKLFGRVNARSKQEALIILERQNLYPLRLKENRLTFSAVDRFLNQVSKKTGIRRYSSRDLMIFCRQLSTLLQAGVPVLKTLYILAGQLENKLFRRQVRLTAQALEEGAGLAEALDSSKGFFPPFLISMVAAGEAGGALDQTLDRLADHFEKQHDLEEKIRSATAYPLFISAVALVVVAVMIIFVLPQFAGIFNQMGMEMPLLSRLLLSAGSTITDHWPLLVISVIVLMITASLILQTEKGRLLKDRLKPRLPIYGKIYRQTIAARFARTMGTLLAGGLTIHQSLNLADRVVDNQSISQSITSLGSALNRGETLAEPLLETGILPPLLAEMVRIGEETGTLEVTLLKTAGYYEKEVSYIVDRLSSILEPVLLLTVGLFIGLLILSVLSPMYQVFQMI